VWVEVKDGIQLDGLDKKWNINGAALVEKIKSLPYPEKCALIDASERWWNFVASGNQPGWLDTLKR
jgi:hypothetical protein